MKILHITSKSKGGAGIAALRLHKALLKKGMASAYLSTDLTIDFYGKKTTDPFFIYKKPSVLKRGLTKVQRLIRPTAFQDSQSYLSDLDQQLDYEIISLPYSNFKLHQHKLVQEADIINLHWVSGILDYPSFFYNCKKPIVWTLHDMNPFLGLFHYKEDENINLQLVSKLDTTIKTIKKKWMNTIKNGSIVSPSNWLLKEAEKSNFFTTFKSKECIPNGIDFNIFKLQNKQTLRDKKEIPSNDFVLLFISGELHSRRKGLDLLLKALTNLKHLKITVITIGKGTIKTTNTSIKIISLGHLKTAEKIAECYAMADAFVMPSREDNLPNVMLESFACGTPVISFATGGMKEHVKEGITGSLANELTGASLANTISSFINNKKAYKQSVIRKYAEDNFSFNKQAENYQKTYQKIINTSR